MSDILNEQLLESKPVRLEKDGQAICVVKVGEEVFAIGDTCTHSDASLSEGDVTKNLIECWLHGAEFDLRTGQPVSLPATTAVPTYSVVRNADGVTITI
jgi:3-phenylpropionate/trans-cinnamate dioxygenase ferredoxin subunit